MIRAEKIKESIRLADALEFYGIEVNRAGFCACPFHAEKTPSMKVYPNDSYYCFGCGAHGDVIDFVRQYFGLSFRESMEKLAEDFNLSGESVHIAIKTARNAFLAKKERERRRKELERLTSEYRASTEWLRVTEIATEIAAQYQKDADDFSDGFAICLHDREIARNAADQLLQELAQAENEISKPVHM